MLLQPPDDVLELAISFTTPAEPLDQSRLKAANPMRFSRRRHQFFAQLARRAPQYILAVERGVDDVDMRARQQTVRGRGSQDHANHVDAIREGEMARLGS